MGILVVATQLTQNEPYVSTSFIYELYGEDIVRVLTVSAYDDRITYTKIKDTNKKIRYVVDRKRFEGMITKEYGYHYTNTDFKEKYPEEFI